MQTVRGKHVCENAGANIGLQLAAIVAGGRKKFGGKISSVQNMIKCRLYTLDHGKFYVHGEKYFRAAAPLPKHANHQYRFSTVLHSPRNAFCTFDLFR